MNHSIKIIRYACHQRARRFHPTKYKSLVRKIQDEEGYVTAHTYDAAGNRTSDCNRVPTTPTANYAYTGNKGTWGGEWNSYTYDALNRLVKEYEHDTALTITYAYDSLGNKTYEKNSQDEKRYTYNEMNQLVTKEAYNRTTNYEYDKRGNRILETSIHTQENRRTFEWDETNHLVKGTRGPDYGLYTSEYTYNGLGIRINSTIMGPDKTIYDRDYVIDYTSPERNDLAEFNLGHYQWQWRQADSEESAAKVHDLTHLYNAAGQRLQTESTRYVDWAGEKHYTRYIHEDIMGSSYYYTNPETGYVTNKHEYTTWGNNTKAPTYNYDPEYRASEPYFTGHPYDGSLNLYYAENRFYDPETGSFLSSDPAESGLNWYQYCNSNPTTYVDPLGLFPTTIEEDDPFFFAKMQDSENHGKIEKGLLDKIEKIKFEDLEKKIPVTEGLDCLTERKLLTAKYLTLMMLSDPTFKGAEYKELGEAFMYAAVANMIVEGEPGLLEGSEQDVINITREYLGPIQQEYLAIHRKCAPSGDYVYADTMERIAELSKLPNVNKTTGGFGFGMHQTTFGRAVYLLDVYLEAYPINMGELTLGQSLAVEYISFKRELEDGIRLEDERFYNYKIERILGGYIDQKDERKNAAKMMVTFREEYEQAEPHNYYQVAEVWYDAINGEEK